MMYLASNTVSTVKYCHKALKCHGITFSLHAIFPVRLIPDICYESNNGQDR